MKKYKLHQWSSLLLLFVIFTSCSQRNYPENNVDNTQNAFKNTQNTRDNYTPPQVISISDELAKSTKDGEMYYDDEYGYRYWRLGDGKYYLDNKYNLGTKPLKQLAKRHHKKNTETDYAHE